MRKGQAVWDDKRNYWYIKVQQNGARRSFYSSTKGIKGKIEAENKADLWLEELNTGKTLVEKKRELICVRELFEDFIKEKEKFGEDFKQYQSYGNNHILPLIGDMQIRNLAEQDLQDIIHAANENGLAKKTQQNIRACLTSFLRYCRKRGCTKLFVEELKIHKDAPEYGKKSLQPNEVAYIFKNDQTKKQNVIGRDRYINAYRFGILTGMRTGEILGLKWEDVSKDNVVFIRRSINKYDKETKGKTKNARRQFKLIPKAVSVLDDQRELLKAEGLESSDWVFPWVNGEHTTTDNLEKAWRRYIKHNNLPKISLYEMSRHTFISINKQMPLELLKMVAGHSESMDTTRIYAHMLEGDLDAAADLIEAQMTSIIDKADEDKMYKMYGVCKKPE